MCYWFLGIGSAIPSSGLLQAFTPTFFILTCAILMPHVLGLEAHAIEGGGLIFDGDVLVRVGVGATCLGGGIPSLSPSSL